MLFTAILPGSVDTSPNSKFGKPRLSSSTVAFQSVLLLIVLLLGAAVRIYRLEELSLWYDEGFSWKMATYPFWEQWDRAAQDNHPPLYFFLLSIWTDIFGRSTFSVRSLSVSCGVVTIWGVYALVDEVSTIARRHSPIFPALFAATLVALNPFQIEWSQTTRMYSLATALAAWSSWGLVCGLFKKPNNFHAWVVFTLSASALIYTHYYGLFVLAAQLLFTVTVLGCEFLQFGFRHPSWRTSIWAISAFGLISLLWLPWFGNFLLQREQAVAHGWTQPFSLEHILRSIAELFQIVWARSPLPIDQAWTISLLVLIVTLGTLIFGRPSERLISLVVGTTFALAIASSFSGRLSVVGARYFVIAHIFILCEIALWLNRLPYQWMRLTGGGVVVALSSWQCLQHLDCRDERASYPSFRTAVGFVESQRKDGEPLFVGRPRVLLTASPHLTRPHSIFVLAKSKNFPFNDGIGALSQDEYLLPANLNQFDADRIWVLDSSTIIVSMPTDWVDVSEYRFQDWTWDELTVRVYERREKLRRLIKPRSTEAL